MAPDATADWSLAVRRRNVDDDGTAVIVAELADAGDVQGNLTVTMTASRHLTIRWDPVEGAPPLTGFEAWSTGD